MDTGRDIRNVMLDLKMLKERRQYKAYTPALLEIRTIGVRITDVLVVEIQK